MTYKKGDRVKSIYQTSDGYFYGTVLEVIKRKSPDWATRIRCKIKWDHGKIETLNQNRFEKN
jgi:hypothetical protein